MYDYYEDDETYDDRPSKSQRKREMLALQKEYGKSLVVVTQPLVELIVMVVFVHLIPRLLPARIVRERHQGGWTQESTACP